MRSYSEIDTIVKRSTKAKGFSWGVAEEIGKNIKPVSYTHLTLPTKA